MRYLASVTYDGSKYYGFQKLEKHKTIQAELERALTKINKNMVVVKGAGRTDRGVHAFNQKFHFDLSVSIPTNHIKSAINSLLEPGIYVNDVIEVDDSFHARFDAKEKIYEYVINLGEYDAIDNDNIYNYNQKLDIKKMKKASKYLLGIHDFEYFVSGKRDNYQNIIYKIKFKRKKDILVITFKGKSFYRYMVRNLVGSLILVGENKITPENLKEMVNKDKKYNYITAPANGLYLVDVKY